MRDFDDGRERGQDEREQDPVVAEQPHRLPSDMTRPVVHEPSAIGTSTYQPMISIAVHALRTVSGSPFFAASPSAM
jgi:hypothetical protein